MKKLFMLSAAMFTLIAVTNAQTGEKAVEKDMTNLKQKESVLKKEKKADKKKLRKLEGKEVSTMAKQQFYQDFGDVSGAKWVRTESFDVVTFTGKNGKIHTAYYDADTQLVGTITHKTFADLPASAQKYINTNYKDYTKGDVIFFDDNEANETDMVLYGEQFDDEDNYFVELSKANNNIVLHVSMQGQVSFFKKLN